MNTHDIGVINALLACLSDGTLFDARDQIKRLQTYAPHMQNELQAYVDIIDHMFVERELADQQIDRMFDKHGLPRSGFTDG